MGFPVLLSRNTFLMTKINKYEAVNVYYNIESHELRNMHLYSDMCRLRLLMIFADQGILSKVVNHDCQSIVMLCIL